MSISAIHKFEINPIQRPVNGVYSTKGGGSVLTFSLGAVMILTCGPLAKHAFGYYLK